MKRTLSFALLLTGLCITLALASVTFSGCQTVAQALNIVNPTYTLRDVRPRVAIALPLSASTIDFDFNLGIDNPNRVGLKLDGVDFDLLVNGNNLLRTSSQQRVSIPARGYGEVHLTSRVGYSNIQSIFQQITDAIQGNRAKYEVRGNAYYDTPAGRMTFPLTVYSTTR